MGNPAGVKRDFDALERRRFKAFALLSKGVSEAEIARQVGAHRQSVNRWAKAIEEQGREGLRQAGRAGRKSRLSEAELIEHHFGLKYHAAHVSWLLKNLGWSCQRPTGKALERDEPAIKQWKKRRWPELKKKPSARGAR